MRLEGNSSFSVLWFPFLYLRGRIVQVKNVTLVCQDWGGPIGLSVVKDCPSLFSRIVMMNTLISDGSDIALSNMYLSGLGYLWKSFARFCGHYLPIRTLFKMLLKGVSDDVSLVLWYFFHCGISLNTLSNYWPKQCALMWKFSWKVIIRVLLSYLIIAFN